MDGKLSAARRDDRLSETAMTAQIPSEFRYDGELYSLVDMWGEGLFIQLDFGMHPYSTCTACWGGHVMNHGGVDSNLLIVGMDINEKEPIPIN